MIFTKLRLHGFKSFVDSSEFLIEPGLTGIVGPNGCGKSNLVEAMRWVMGESSYKNMRASGMDDVIFSGSGNRPARNIAEVSLTIDNSARSAPAAFNQAETLEVTRRIERESGSVYRVNGKEVRARDVQLLFADASSGARSPAMVRQGQIGEIISAKPQAQRRILEEAAGVAGLYSRRHEAELRLKGAADNLLRLEDVLTQLSAQIAALQGQAAQAVKYRDVSAQIRKAEALLMLIAHRDAQSQLGEAQKQAATAVQQVQDSTYAQAQAARNQAICAAELPPLREAEARAGATVQRLVLARQELDAQERRAKERVLELAKQISQLGQDGARERALIADADSVLERLRAEQLDLAKRNSGQGEQEALLRAGVEAAETHAAKSEQILSEAQGELARFDAQFTVLRAAIADAATRAQRLTGELAQVDAERRKLTASQEEATQGATLRQAFEHALAERTALDDVLTKTEQKLAGLRNSEAVSRGPLQEAERIAQRLETEARTLARLLTSPAGQKYPAVLEQISVEKGYEAALGAALGDDLDGSLEAGAPSHWADLAGDDAALPQGTVPLLNFTTAPTALRRRLAQVGVVLRRDGAALQAQLKAGQRLVSREGDLWRWDGFAQVAEAPSASAKRLQEKNRLSEVEKDAAEARRAAESLAAQMATLQQAITAAASQDSQNRLQGRACVRKVETARDALSAFDRAQAHVQARLAAVNEAQQRLQGTLLEAEALRTQADVALQKLGTNAALAQSVESARTGAIASRQASANARSALSAYIAGVEGRLRRLQALDREEADWRARKARAQGQVQDFATRQANAQAEHAVLLDAPDQLILQRRSLLGEIAEAEAGLKLANDTRARGETALGEADRAARQALEAMSGAREAAARAGARLEAAQVRLTEVEHAILEALDSTPAGLAALAGINLAQDLPDARQAERSLSALRTTRERLGAVNLRAETELNDVGSRRDKMVQERDDLTEAIRRLRLAIQSLNREGRQRLLAAFERVNGHFKALFVTLFGGGEAELQLVESDDPLEAGLEILARPPGKKPQTMTLLSGGEQALTAMSLIFAIFLTNPSPICVLDEVDAPLDDANVERFCDLLDEMERRTDTRFITITHNPITMARMKRLFGVTMAERGVSQLVSVDLEQAERFLGAG